MTFKALDKRYSEMEYRKCGASGLKLPLISLGLWHNFGGKTINPESKKVLFKAFDLGITHFDLANNYGPPYGSAEANFGKIMKRDLKKYRDELIISSKAGYDMWDGPYGEWGSKKHVIASCDQSLKRMNLDYVDIFCEKGYFSLQDTEKILDAGITHGLTPKIHVNQFNSFGGVKLGVKKNALSVDHLEVMNDDDIKALKNSKTIPVALPTCSFFLGIPYSPARKIINQGLPFALASDYNPGSTPSGNMNFVVATACIKMKITPEEAINAATINGAYAIDSAHKVGPITRGKIANFMITKPINSYQFIPYAFGNHQIEKVYLKGKEVNE